MNEAQRANMESMRIMGALYTPEFCAQSMAIRRKAAAAWLAARRRLENRYFLNKAMVMYYRAIEDEERRRCSRERNTLRRIYDAAHGRDCLRRWGDYSMPNGPVYV